jgi:hypothetical protein
MNQPEADNSHAHAGFQSRQEIDTLYTPLDEALAQLNERRADKKLHTALNKFHQALPPTFLPSEPVGALFRHIITPNHELDLFLTTVHQTGLRALCLEYRRDIFYGRNRDKYRLCRPAFTVRCNQVRGLKIVDFEDQTDGAPPRPMDELMTRNGWGLVRWHHALLEHAHPASGPHVADYSAWISQASRHEFYYLRYLALFICDGILFENFLADDPEELRFARERVIPSFAKAVELFGVRPLIVPLLPRESECDDRWRSHDGALYSHAVNLLRQRHDADS